VIASIEEAEGKLTDHYDPRDKTLRLSSDIYSGTSLSAIGVAAHEAGHAIQDGFNSRMMALRNLTVPLASFGSSFGDAHHRCRHYLGSNREHVSANG
jgi:Zn-dependent membrane protease YugP